MTAQPLPIKTPPATSPILGPVFPPSGRRISFLLPAGEPRPRIQRVPTPNPPGDTSSASSPGSSSGRRNSRSANPPPAPQGTAQAPTTPTSKSPQSGSQSEQRSPGKYKTHYPPRA